MNRLLVALLAAFDAALAAAVGLAAALAPLTLLWVFGFGVATPWTILWPASARIWELGHLVPLHIVLPPEYLVSIGLDPDAASFVLSLAPLAFAAFTAVFAARSGVRAASAGAWIIGVVSGAVVFTAAAAGVALTSANDIAGIELWQAILFPALVFTVPALIGALVAAWQHGDDGLIDDLRDRVDAWAGDWPEVPGLIARGAAIAFTGLVGAGALIVGLAFVLRGAEVIALFQSTHVDALGATVLTIGQLAYLPTLIVWGLSFVAGPGFALGAGTAVSPAATQVGVVPGIPVLGIIPESTSSWLLMLALVPVALGAFAGWVVRSRLVGAHAVAALEARRQGDAEPEQAHEPVGARLVTAVGISIVTAAGVAVVTLAAAGALGPDRLAAVGPQPGPVALAVGLEVLVGAAILLLSPHRSAATELVGAEWPDVDSDGVDVGEPSADAGAADPSADEPILADSPRRAPSRRQNQAAALPDFAATAPIEPLSAEAATDVLGRRRGQVSSGGDAAGGDRPPKIE